MVVTAPTMEAMASVALPGARGLSGARFKLRTDVRKKMYMLICMVLLQRVYRSQDTGNAYILPEHWSLPFCSVSSTIYHEYSFDPLSLPNNNRRLRLHSDGETAEGTPIFWPCQLRLSCSYLSFYHFRSLHPLASLVSRCSILATHNAGSNSRV